LARRVVITGLGLVSALGEGEAEHWAALAEGGERLRTADTAIMAPVAIHPIRKLDLSRYIPNKGDQRAMGPLMHYGVYAAGMALEDAGVRGDDALLKRTHAIVGSCGGERDIAVDDKVLAGLEGAHDPGAFLNQTLMTELRPTLFLAQLPNLFAGNISLVHGVSGSSRTFMGEEMAGVDAVRVAFERIRAGQGELFLVGSAFNAERPDMAVVFAPGGFLARGAQPRLWARGRDGMAMGSMGAFLVLESEEHAKERGRPPIARLSSVMADRSDRRPGAATRNALDQWSSIRPDFEPEALCVLSGASGAGPATEEERCFLASLSDGLAVRGTAQALGHGVEATFLANLVLAAACLRRERLFAPLDAEEPIERPMDRRLAQVVVTQWGHHRGEAMALVERLT
jgi:3-oxoacyl-[acyl-carrier-protein] synthase II